MCVSFSAFVVLYLYSFSAVCTTEQLLKAETNCIIKRIIINSPGGGGGGGGVEAMEREEKNYGNSYMYINLIISQ